MEEPQWPLALGGTTGLLYPLRQQVERWCTHTIRIWWCQRKSNFQMTPSSMSFSFNLKILNKNNIIYMSIHSSTTTRWTDCDFSAPSQDWCWACCKWSDCSRCQISFSSKLSKSLTNILDDFESLPYLVQVVWYDHCYTTKTLIQVVDIGSHLHRTDL